MAKGSCTHLTLTRLYDQFGCGRCSLCYRRPPLGWLYRCTQDSDGQLPASDFFEGVDLTRTEYDVQLFTLSHSISEAANNGHYTDEQLYKLWQQKGEVRKSIQEVRPITAGSDSTTSSSSYSLPASTTISTTTSSKSDSEPDFCSALSTRHPLHSIEESCDDISEVVKPRSIDIVPSTLPPLCDFKVCHTCRPIYRDRAWLSLNGVLGGACKPPPRHEFDNRRVSNAIVVRNLGGTKLEHKLYGEGLHTTESGYSKRCNRSQFSNTVRKMLQQSQSFGGSEGAIGEQRVDIEPYDLKKKAHFDSGDRHTRLRTDESELLRIPLCPSSMKLDPLDTSLRPLYARRGVERLTTIPLPSRSSISHCDERTATQSGDRSAVSCPAVLQQDRPVYLTSNGDEDNPSNTTTKSRTSTREGLYMFSDKTRKDATRHSTDETDLCITHW